MPSQRVLINLTRGAEDPDRATVAFVMANAALGLEKEVVVLLSTEGVRVGDKRVINAVREPGFQPLADLVASFLDGGGQIWACTPCVAKRQLQEALHEAVKPVGAVAALEFLCDNGVSLSF